MGKSTWSSPARTVMVEGTLTLGSLLASWTTMPPAGGMVVQLASSDPSVSVPSTITVLAGDDHVDFPITTSAPAADTYVTISAAHDSDNAQAALLTVDALRHVIAVDLGNG